MDLAPIVAHLESTQVPKRLLHIYGVLQTSMALAKVHGFDENKIILAALLHDCAKHQGKEELQRTLTDGGVELPQEDQDFPALWHGPAGAVLARTKFGVEDEEVLDAVANHTVGHHSPSPTLKALMLADFCEPTREFPGVESFRELARTDVDTAMVQMLKSKIAHLESKNKAVHSRIYGTLKSLEV